MKEVISSQFINIILLTSGALQGIILSLYLLRTRLKNHARPAILLFLAGLISIQLLLKVASKVWLLQNLNSWYALSYDLPFLYGPLIYLYTRFSVNAQARLTNRDLLHFLPFLLIFLNILAFNLVPKPL